MLKVSLTLLLSLIKWTHVVFQWYVARLVVKNGHEKDMCTNEIGLFAQNKDAILVSIVNTMGRGLCANMVRKRIFTLESYKLCIPTPIFLKLDFTTFTICNC